MRSVYPHRVAIKCSRPSINLFGIILEITAWPVRKLLTRQYQRILASTVTLLVIVTLPIEVLAGNLAIPLSSLRFKGSCRNLLLVEVCHRVHSLALLRLKGNKVIGLSQLCNTW